MDKKIKQIKKLILKKSTETLYLSNEIRDLLKIGINYCEHNLDINEVCILNTLFKIINEKSKILITKLDKNMIELVNFDLN